MRTSLTLDEFKAIQREAENGPDVLAEFKRGAWADQIRRHNLPGLVVDAKPRAPRGPYKIRRLAPPAWLKIAVQEEVGLFMFRRAVARGGV